MPHTPFAAFVQTPVYPKTLHQSRPAKAAASAKPSKRDDIFSKSRDTREMKTSPNAGTFPHAR